MSDDSNVIKRCKETNLPPPQGDQYYLVEVQDGGKKVFSATKIPNAFDIISNALCIHSMDWSEMQQRAGRRGEAEPSFEVTPASEFGGTEQRFEFECGEFLVIADGPYDFDDVLVQKKRDRQEIH